MDFLDELDARIVPGDGDFGGSGDACREALNADAPDRVRAFHESHLGAGARVIRTNSLGGNFIRLGRSGNDRRAGELNWLAAQIAGAAAKAAGARFAACAGPLGLSAEESAQADRHAIFEEQLGALLDGGARLVVLEGFTLLDELVAAVEAKHTLHHCPVIASVVCDAAGRMPDGNSLSHAVKVLRAAEADVIGVHDDGGDPAALLPAIRSVETGAIRAAFPGAGGLAPAAFADLAMALAETGVRFIAGAGGVSPAHIGAFTARLGNAPPAS